METTATNAACVLPDISVILCTHNPREDFLRETLDALKAQTLPHGRWELLLVDNASKEPLAGKWDLSWQPQARHIREETLGLTPARLRGIAAARAPLLVFVDDDNVLAPDYLERALEIASAFPRLGAWGGNLIPRYEVPPPEWVLPYVHMLALWEVPKDVWSNLPVWSVGTCPAGAGMVIRKVVALEYAGRCARDQRRARLDRKGSSLIGCGDLDMAFTACDMGLGTGLFARLKLTHIIPTARLKKEYLLRLAEGNGYSGVWLEAIRSGKAPRFAEPSSGLLARCTALVKRLPGLSTERDRLKMQFQAARLRGCRQAMSALAEKGGGDG